ncbi:MAG: Multidrug export protein EmrA [Planctomycetota bacterium]
MIARVALILLVTVALCGLIIYSQFRHEPPRVSGIIEADEVRLGSRVGGRVAKVLVEEGDAVDHGALLIELEPYDLLEREAQAARLLAAREADLERLANGLREEEIAQAKARFDRLQARWDLLEAGPREQELEAAKARLRGAQSELKLKRQLFERYSELAQNKAISAQEFERTTEEFEAAESTLIVRQEELELLEQGSRDEEKREARAAAEEAKQAWRMAVSGYRREDIDQARASRDAAQAALDAVVRQKEELLIRSPVAGRVDSLDLQPGDMVIPSAPVISMVDERHLWVRAYVPQSRSGMRVGQRLRVTVDSLPGKEFVGTLSYVARQAEFTPSNVQTPEERSKQVFRVKVTLENEIALENTDPMLRPGMTADLWLEPIPEKP